MSLCSPDALKVDGISARWDNVVSELGYGVRHHVCSIATLVPGLICDQAPQQSLKITALATASR